MRTTHTLVAVAAALLADREGQHFGYDISKRAGVRSGALYPLLSRLLAEGWIEDEWELPGETAQGRPQRRYYRITEHGMTELGAIVQRAAADARFRGLPLGSIS